MKKYFDFMFGAVTYINRLTYLRTPLDEELLYTWCNKPRMMWSTPGFLLSAGKPVTLEWEIKDIDAVSEPLYKYRPVNVKADDNGILQW